MTNVGYDQIAERIRNRTVDPPVDVTVAELSAWLTGYAKCQLDILDLIFELREGNAQRN